MSKTIETQPDPHSTWLWHVYVDGLAVGLGSKQECTALAAELESDSTKAQFVFDCFKKES